MKKYFLGFVLILFLLTLGAGVRLFFPENASLVIYSFFFSLVVYGIFNYVYNFLKMNSCNKKQVFFIYIGYGIFSLLSFIILYHQRFSSLNCFLFFILLLSSFLTTLFIRKEYDTEKWVFSIFLIAIVQLFSLGILETNMILLYFVTSFTLYITTLFDNLAIYRKKNFLFMFLIGLVLGSVFVIYPGSSIVLFFLFLIISRKRGIKSAIKLSSAMIVGYLFSIIFQMKLGSFDMTIYFMPFTSQLSNFILALLGFLFLYGTIYAFFKPERKMGYLCRSFIVFLAVFTFIWQDYSFFYGISCFIPVFLLLLLQIFDNVPILFRRIVSIYHKNIVPQSIGSEKVSVVIPNYNYENYLIERIDSVLFQNYKIYELIVLDDCSTDQSVAVIEKKLEEVRHLYPDIKVKFLPNKENSRNVFKQWSKCFDVATGDYLWICEADDSANAKFLENVMSSFQDEKVVISYSESLTMDENNYLLMPNLRSWIDTTYCGKWNHNYHLSGEEELTSTFCINNTIANVSSAVFRLQKDIPYQEYLKGAQDYRLAGDWYFYVKVLGHGDIAYHRKSLNYHRMHSKSVTLTTKGDQEFQEICKVQDMIQDSYSLSDKVKKQILEYREILKCRFFLGEEEIDCLNIPWKEVLQKSKVKDKVLLSIIIPVYNTEPYLRKCLDSVLLKIPSKTEIIIVNDGSPDHSEEIISEYEKKYPKIIHGYKKKNGGLSSAKNFGLKKAQGRYLVYLDSDDFVNPNMYEVMLKKALLLDADLVYCDIFELFEDGSKMFFSMKNYEREDEKFQLIDTSLMAASWNKLCKRELFEGLQYPEGLNNEDIAISPILFERAQKIAHIDSPFYYYLQRSGSIQNSGFNEKRFVIFDTAKLCFDKLEKMNAKYIEEIKGSIYTHQLLGLLIYVIAKQPRKVRKKYYEMFCDRMNEFEDFASNQYVIEYLESYHLGKLVHYIKNKNILAMNYYLWIKMQ